VVIVTVIDERTLTAISQKSVIWVYSGVFTFLVEAVSCTTDNGPLPWVADIDLGDHSTLFMLRPLWRQIRLLGHTLQQPFHWVWPLAACAVPTFH
jgi:hypothetical protein